MFKSLPKVQNIKCPKQPNGYDCGVYVLKYGELLFKIYPKTASKNRELNLGDQFNTKMFNQDDINKFRENYKNELLELARKYKGSLKK